MDTNNERNNKNLSLGLIAEYGGSDSDSEDGGAGIVVNDDERPELSEMVLKNNIINACAHGPLSRVAESEDSIGRPMIIDAQGGDVGYEVTMYREDETTSDSSSSDDSDIDSVKDIEEISSGDEEAGHGKEKRLEAPKVNGELGLEDLPPIEDLAISLPAQQTTHIGTVSSIVEQLVIVKANPGTPAVDLDSVLFLENGSKTLGKVFDVFGPVKEPHYAVRFNSRAHVAARGVTVGADVCIAPHDHTHTTFVFLPDLMKIRGSDASWKNDIEPPPSLVEYSDDEEERRARRDARQRHSTDHAGEPSRNNRKTSERRNQRPTESSSRFGWGCRRGAWPRPPDAPVFGAIPVWAPRPPFLYHAGPRGRAPPPLLPPPPRWMHAPPPPPPPHT